MWRHVVYWIDTSVSEELSAPIFYSIEAADSSETLLATYQVTRSHIL
jgi:hypothetical protein